MISNVPIELYPGPMILPAFGLVNMIMMMMTKIVMWAIINLQNDSNGVFKSKVSVEVEVWDGPPGPRWCHCMRGPLSPDADSCDLWP